MSEREMLFTVLVMKFIDMPDETAGRYDVVVEFVPS